MMVHEPGLWPVLLVGSCLLLAMIGFVILRAIESQNPLWALLVVMLLAGTLIAGVRDSYRRQLGLVSRFVVGLWGLATLAAFISMSAP